MNHEIEELEKQAVSVNLGDICLPECSSTMTTALELDRLDSNPGSSI